MKIEIAVAIDTKYLQHFYVLLESIKEFKLSQDCYRVHVVYTNLNRKDLYNLRKIYNGIFVFTFYDISEYDLNDLYISAHISTETYYRILLPDILQQELNKVIYLDCDLIVNRNLAELWINDIENFAVGAVFDYKAQNRKDELNIPQFYDYFNAGVLLINLDYWRKNNFVQKLLNFIRSNPDKLLYWDQDAINALMYHKANILPVNWNVQSVILETPELSGSLVDAKVNPSIIHFTGATKPWHISSISQYKETYYAYLKRTPYSGFDRVNEKTKTIIKVKKNIFIWGAGPTGERVYDYLQLDINGFVDSDPSKWGTYIKGKQIFSVNNIYKLDSLGIIICSGYFREIANELVKLGFREGEDFVHQM